MQNHVFDQMGVMKSPNSASYLDTWNLVFVQQFRTTMVFCDDSQVLCRSRFAANNANMSTPEMIALMAGSAYFSGGRCHVSVCLGLLKIRQRRREGGGAADGPVKP